MDRKMLRFVEKTRSSNRQDAPSEDRSVGSALKGIEARRPPLPGARWPSRRLPEAEGATHFPAPRKRGWPLSPSGPSIAHLLSNTLLGVCPRIRVRNPQVIASKQLAGFEPN